jgi:hypothetical protein
MKKLLIPFLFALAIILQSNSCKKNNTTTPVYNTEFPNNIGTWWKYKVFDSIYYRLDTVTINIVGNTKLDDGTDVSVWAIKSLLNGNDTNYVSNKSDGIRIYQFIRAANGAIKKYLFPITVGSKWITGNILDTNRVTQQGSISVIAGTFNGYRINRDVNIPPGLNRIIEEEWFVPNIGMVSRNYAEFGTGGIAAFKWELVSYFIK